jgi:hypothetical protein
MPDLLSSTPSANASTARVGQPADRGPRPGLLRQAVAEDISLAGLRVLGLRAPIGQSLVVALALPGDRRVQLRCSVVRQDATGVAIEFDGLDWDDLFALARFLHPRLP